MIDTHAHIDSLDYDSDRQEVINRAHKDGVQKIIIPAIDPSGWNNLLNLVKKNDNLYCALGIHPHNVSDLEDKSFDELKELCDNKKVIAIGEIGLDYYYDFAPKNKQIDSFEKQLSLARELSLPAIIHNREADIDVLKIINNYQNGFLKGVLHCFSSPIEIMYKLIDLGMYLSFTGNITFKNSKLGEVVMQTPMDKIMIETDSPYMSPVPYRGKRNEPSLVKLVAEKIAEIKSVPIDEVISMTTKNALRLFNLGILLFFFLFTFNNLNAQPSQKSDNIALDLFQDDTVWVNPYAKYIGFGPLIGINTIIQTYDLSSLKLGSPSISYEGILTFGGTFEVGILDFLLADVTYIYSKNKKVIQYDTSGSLIIGPNIHQTVEMSFKFIANPYSKINFFASIGPSLVFTQSDIGVVGREGSYRSWAINTSIGFMINIPVKSVGMFDIVAEWKLNFEINKPIGFWLKNRTPLDYALVQSSTFYSIPRATIIWYPSFIKW